MKRGARDVEDVPGDRSAEEGQCGAIEEPARHEQSETRQAQSAERIVPRGFWSAAQRCLFRTIPRGDGDVVRVAPLGPRAVVDRDLGVSQIGQDERI